MEKTSHTLESIAALHAELTPVDLAYLASNPALMGTLDTAREYVRTHWLYGETRPQEQEQMALDNYGCMLAAYIRGTLGLWD